MSFHGICIAHFGVFADGSATARSCFYALRATANFAQVTVDIVSKAVVAERVPITVAKATLLAEPTLAVGIHKAFIARVTAHPCVCLSEMAELARASQWQ